MTTAQHIPTRPLRAAQSITVTLDGARYRVDLDWNARIGRWFLSLFGASGSAIVRSKALVLGSDLLRQARHSEACPRGLLIVRDMQDQDAEASLDSLGVRHRLYFVPLSEVGL